jgi:RimJ/RimL family protein N-acetyltransferase
VIDRSREAPAPGLAAGLFGRIPDLASSRCPHAGAPEREIIAETPRLILRRHEAADFPAYLEMCADPVMSRFSGLAPAGSEEAWMRLLRQAGHWSLFGYGFVAVEEKASGRLVGETGLGDFKRPFGSAFDDSPEAGWAIARWAQGRGYATEAAAAVLEWVESHLGIRRTVCLIHVDNEASIRVAEKLGYTPFGACDYRGYSATIFERPRL